MPLLLAKRRSLFRRELVSIIEYLCLRVNQRFDENCVVLYFYTMWSFVLLLALFSCMVNYLRLAPLR